MKTLIILLLLCGVAWADPIVDKDNKSWSKIDKAKDYKAYAKDKFTTTLNASGCYEKIAKPKIDEAKLLTEAEGADVKMALWNEGLVDETNKVVKEGRKLIFAQAKPAKNDYKHDFDRGTIHFTTELRKDGTPLLHNYSYHKVIIPDGTIIRECNFTQRKPDTLAIQGKNLTFIECNLVNVKIDPTWIVESCNTTQVQRTLLKQTALEGGITEIEVSRKVKGKGETEFGHEEITKENIPDSELNNALLLYQ